MSSDSMKKLGVAVIVALFAVFIVGLLVLMLVVGADLWATAVYAVVYLAFLAVLAYEGWVRLKEIDEGLEDAVNHY